MSEVNLKKASTNVDVGVDSTTIVHFIEGVPGGRSLDVSGFSPTIIRAGHVVIKETSTGVHKPMPVSGSSYDSLPSGHEVVGVVVSSVMANEAIVAIMVRGSVNEATSPYPVTSEIKKALPLIRFIKD